MIPLWYRPTDCYTDRTAPVYPKVLVHRSTFYHIPEVCIAGKAPVVVQIGREVGWRLCGTLLSVEVFILLGECNFL